MPLFIRKAEIVQFGIRKLFLAASIIAVMCVLYVAARNRYYADRIQVQSILAGVQGISDIKLHPHFDVVEEVNHISVTVENIPDSMITFGGLADYGEAGRFSVGRIGKWQFRISGRRHGLVFDSETGESIESSYFSGHITFGRGSPYNKLLPFEINTVQDLVDHYEDLVQVLANWPRETKPGSVVLDDGSTQFYSVREAPNSSK
jgi:hypothetical protein